jgi:L-amino acid N-acyltransferase YncA
MPSPSARSNRTFRLEAELEPLTIRDAGDADVAAILAIYGHHARSGLGTFEEDAPPRKEMETRMVAVQSEGLPYLVAERGGTILGFAYAAPFRMRRGYRLTAEDSVYVAIEACEALGLRQLTAVIGDSGNAASIGLHAALGFKHTGSSTAVGFKHGRWVDIVFMQRALNGGDQTPPNGAGLNL